MRRIGYTLALLFSLTSSSLAHYNMLLPDKSSVEKAEKITLTYQYGHPFEHELSDAPRPLAISVIDPGKAVTAIDVKAMKPTKKMGADGKPVDVWQFSFTPMIRGDHTFVLQTPTIKHDDKATKDIVRVAVHAQTQNGWDNPSRVFDKGLDILPYTRPYGLLPGMIFKGRVVRLPFPDDAKAKDINVVDGLPIEFEKYNETPPKKLPTDELITFKAKADARGFFAVAFPEAGWWGVTATAARGFGDDVVRHTTTWIHVDEKK